MRAIYAAMNWPDQDPSLTCCLACMAPDLDGLPHRWWAHVEVTSSLFQAWPSQTPGARAQPPDTHHQAYHPPTSSPGLVPVFFV